MSYSSHRLNFVFLSLILLNFVCISFQLPLDQKTMMQNQFTEQELSEWEDYKTKFEKVYGVPEENLKHMSIYFDNKKKIEEHNKLYKEGKVSFEMGINQFADKTPEEFKNTCCGVIQPDKALAGSS